MKLIPASAKSLLQISARSWRENWVRATWALTFWAQEGCLLPILCTDRMKWLSGQLPLRRLFPICRGEADYGRSRSLSDGTETEWLSSLLFVLVKLFLSISPKPYSPSFAEHFVQVLISLSVVTFWQFFSEIFFLWKRMFFSLKRMCHQVWTVYIVSTGLGVRESLLLHPASCLQSSSACC